MTDNVIELATRSPTGRVRPNEPDPWLTPEIKEKFLVRTLTELINSERVTSSAATPFFEASAAQLKVLVAAYQLYFIAATLGPVAAPTLLREYVWRDTVLLEHQNNVAALCLYHIACPQHPSGMKWCGVMAQFLERALRNGVRPEEFASHCKGDSADDPEG